MFATFSKIVQTNGRCIGGVGAKLKVTQVGPNGQPIVRIFTVNAVETKSGREADGSYGGTWLHGTDENHASGTVIKAPSTTLEVIQRGNGSLLKNLNPIWENRRQEREMGQAVGAVAEARSKANEKTIQKVVQEVIHEEVQGSLKDYSDALGNVLKDMVEKLGSETRKVGTVAVYTSKKVDRLDSALRAMAKELGINEKDFNRIVDEYIQADLNGVS